VSTSSLESQHVASAGPVRPAYRAYVLGILFLVYVFNFVDRRLLTILGEPIQHELGVSDTVMGLLYGPAFGIFYTLAGLFIACWADRGVRRSIIALGLTVWSVLTAVSGVVTSAGQLALARIGVGLGEAACTPPAHSLLADYYPPARRATALSIYSTGIYVGILLSLAVGGWLAAEVGWRWTFVLVGLPGVALAVVVRCTVREPVRGALDPVPSTGSPVTVASLRDAFRFLWPLRSFRHLALGAALNSFVGYALGTWLPSFYTRVHDMAIGERGLWLGLIFGGAGAAGTLLGGVLTDRYGPRDVRWRLRIPALATWLAVPVTVAALLWSGRVGSLIWLIPTIVLHSLYLGPVFAITQTLVPPSMRALAASVLILFMNLIGLGLGPLVVGKLSDLFQAHTDLGVCAIQYALLTAVPVRLWAGWHLHRGARWLAAELPRATRPADRESA
jgi:MFS family permease